MRKIVVSGIASVAAFVFAILCGDFENDVTGECYQTSEPVNFLVSCIGILVVLYRYSRWFDNWKKDVITDVLGIAVALFMGVLLVSTAGKFDPNHEWQSIPLTVSAKEILSRFGITFVATAFFGIPYCFIANLWRLSIKTTNHTQTSLE
jgi:hypothetical protein